jgi:hypothetical protein
MRSLIARLIGLALLALASSARAGGPKVTVLRAGLDAASATRISAELVASGFDIVEAAEPDEPSARGSVAFLRAAREAGGIEVCVRRAPVARKQRCEVVRADAASADAASVPIRAVELLRAALLDVRRRRPPRPPPSLAPITPAPPAPPLPRFGVDLAPAVLFPGGLSPAPGLLLGARWMPARFVGVSTMMFIPLFSSRVTSTEGSASVRAALLGGGLRLATRLADTPCVPALELGVAGVWLHTTGDVVAPYIARAVDRVAAAPYARAGLGIDLARHVGLRGDVLGGAALPAPDIVFAGHTVATWGRPFFIASLGVDVHW